MAGNAATDESVAVTLIAVAAPGRSAVAVARRTLLDRSRAFSTIGHVGPLRGVVLVSTLAYDGLATPATEQSHGLCRPLRIALFQK